MKYISVLKDLFVKIAKHDRIKLGNLNRLEALDRSNRITMPIPLQDKQLGEAKLFWTRESACEGLNFRPNDVLEIGTLAGDFAQFFLDLWKPKSLVLIDLFNGQDYVFGVQRFEPVTHLAYVSNRFMLNSEVELIQGYSHNALKELIAAERLFDFIYIDAGHTFEDVSIDMEFASKLLRPGGIIGMNDYIMTDYYYDTVYGVVQATNSFLSKHPEYRVVAFAFNNNLFADIYIKKEL